MIVRNGRAIIDHGPTTAHGGSGMGGMLIQPSISVTDAERHREDQRRYKARVRNRTIQSVAAGTHLPDPKVIEGRMTCGSCLRRLRSYPIGQGTYSWRHYSVRP